MGARKRNSAHRQNVKKSGPKAQPLSRRDLEGEFVHQSYLLNRTDEARDRLVHEAKKRIEFASHHGAVKIIMVGGKPGPDAPKE